MEEVSLDNSMSPCATANFSEESYYRARYYDQNAGRFLSEDQRDATPRNQLFNLYLYVLGNPVNLTDPLGQFILKPGEDLPWPNLRLQALLECIEFKTGLSLVVTSTTEPHQNLHTGPTTLTEEMEAWPLTYIIRSIRNSFCKLQLAAGL